MSVQRLSWQAIGPARPEGEDVPPVSMLLDGYLLCFDEKLQRSVYVCGPGYDGFGESYALEGREQGWRALGEQKISLDGEAIHQGDYDAVRGGIVAWRWGYADDGDGLVPRAMLIIAGVASELETSGETPRVDEDNDGAGLIAFHAARGVWVAVCSSGVYELAADNAWRRVSEDASLLPARWNDHGFGGLYDAKRARCVLYCFQQKGGDYRYVLLGWDGATLEEITLDGLPREALHYGLYQPGCVLSAHPEHGVVLYAGDEHGLFALGDDGWHALQGHNERGPPRMGNAHMCFDARLEALVIGPGFHEGDSGGADQQRLFYLQQASGWQRMGVVSADSPLAKASYGKVHLSCWRGGWYAVATHCLQTWRFDEARGWVELVDKARGEALWGWAPMQLVASAEGLLAVAESGAVFAFDGDDWTQRCAASAVFKQREEAMLACEPGGRVLAWGGKLRGRKSNNTLLLEASDWRQLKGKSDKPKDFAAASGRGGTTIDFTCTFDTTLGCLVRFGYEEAALLDGETWRGKTPKGYKRAIGPRFFQHVAAHDAESGETLLIDLEGGRISRFDLQGCVELARFDYPAALQPAKQHDTPAWARLRDSFCVDKAGRALKAQVLDDAWGSYRLDLAPAFEAARAVGPRGVARGRKAKEHE